jgi:hypothetical protein
MSRNRLVDRETIRWQQYLRYQLGRTPRFRPKNSALVGLPDGNGPLGLKLPVHDVAIRVARHEARVVVYEPGTVDLGRVAAENVAWLGGITGSRLALAVGRHGGRRGRRCSRAEQVLDGRHRKVGAKIAARKWLVVASLSISLVAAAWRPPASQTASRPQRESNIAPLPHA